MTSPALLDQPPAQFEFATFNSLKADPNRTTSKKAPFLFIVKTPASDTLSRSTTRSAAASINSHAQQWAQEVAMAQSRKGITATREREALVFKNCVMRCRVSRLLDEPGHPTKRKRSRVRSATGQTPEAPSGKVASQRSEEIPTYNETGSSTIVKQDSLMRSRSSQDAPLTELYPSRPIPSLPPSISTPLDFVDSHTLAVDGDVQLILQYFLSFALVSTAQQEDGQQPREGSLTRHKVSSINTIMQGCMQKSMHMYALLAATSSRMRRVSGVVFRADKGPEMYLQQALQRLRMLLDTDSQSIVQDSQIILDIYYLSVCGWYTENYEESQIHFNVLKRFWKMLAPRRSTLDQYIYDLLSYNTMSLEPRIAGLSSSDCSSWSHHGAIKDTLHRPSVAFSNRGRYCSALQLSLEQAACSPHLRDIVQEFPRFLHAYNGLSHLSNPRGPEQDMVRLTSKALVLRLLELPSYGAELCCRLALLIILRHMINSRSPTRSSSDDIQICLDPALVTQRLRQQLQYEILLPSNEISPATLLGNESSQRPIWTGISNHFLLWILVMGLFGTRLTDQQDEYLWFWARTKPMLRLLGISTMSQLREAMAVFVFVEAMLEDQRIDGILVA